MTQILQTQIASLLERRYSYDSSAYQDPPAHLRQKEADGAYADRCLFLCECLIVISSCVFLRVFVCKGERKRECD